MDVLTDIILRRVTLFYSFVTPAPPDFYRWNNSAHEIYYPRSTGVDKYAMSRM